MMAAYALDAVDHARASSGVELDFSIESVREVERVLDLMFKRKPRGFFGSLFRRAPSPEDISTFAKMYGGYVGEVVRKVRGGEWYMDSEVSPGSMIVGLRRGDTRIWPTAKVGKRLINGAEDNVWSYFRIVLEEQWL
jgi:hypothetical protein